MTTRILVIGGYGNFGAFIARRLSREADISLIVAGRSTEKAKLLADSLNAESMTADIPRTIDAVLQAAKPDIVIHTCGPFQGQGYEVAEACIRHRAHYIDLADGRDFVTGITRLNAAAEAAGVLVISGASSVPALTSAIIDQYRSEFGTLETIDYAIATAQKTNRGLATTKGVLSYAGKPFETLIDGAVRRVYGWQGLHWHKFSRIGWRALGNCDVPDLALFPLRYPGLRTIRFSAGLELPVVHLSLWALTWLVRAGILANLRTFAPAMLSLSRLFDPFGTDISGFFMEMGGSGANGTRQQITFDLTARSGDGPMIPCVAAIVAALGLARGQITARGAMPCVGLVTLDSILGELRPLDIHWTLSHGP